MGFAIMPLFAFANAGVVLAAADIGQAVYVAIFAGLVFGKPLGVVVASWLAVRLGFAILPHDLRWPLLAGGSLLTGIGFTMSLFIAGLAFAPAMLNSAKIGILSASVVSAAAGLLSLFALTLRRRTA
jgi:NhaA family Na+:H+ antiporter